MKVAVLSESPDDEAAIRILVEALLGRPTISIDPPLQTPRGWTSVIGVLPSVLKYLHYQTDVEAIAVVIDSDNSPAHQPEHERPNDANDQCRLCKLRGMITRELSGLRQVPGRMALKTAVGLAVPAIEAWYLCEVDPHAIEAHFMQMHASHLTTLRRELKRNVYGNDRPPQSLKMKFAVQEATRLAQNLDILERLFPNGFGALANDVRGW